MIKAQMQKAFVLCNNGGHTAVYTLMTSRDVSLTELDCGTQFLPLLCLPEMHCACFSGWDCEVESPCGWVFVESSRGTVPAI